MRKTVHITILGDPVPWTPARIFGRGYHYDPKQKEKKWAILQAIPQYMGHEPIKGPVRVDITAHMPVPSSESKKTKGLMLEGKIPHTRKPDRINLGKFYEDVLEKAGILENDSQIVSGEITKKYSENPHIDLIITPLA